MSIPPPNRRASLRRLALLPAVSLLLAAPGSAQNEREIVGIRVGADEIVLQSSGRIASVTAAPVEQERTVLLILGHRPVAGLSPPAAPTGGLVRDVELRTETSGSTVFTKVLVATSRAVKTTIETSGAEARIRFAATESPVLLPPQDDLFVAETGSASPTDEGARLRTVAPVYFRDGPGQRYAALQVVDEGQRAELLGREGDWSWIRLDDGSEGWVHEDFVAADGPLPLRMPSEVGVRSAPEPAVATRRMPDEPEARPAAPGVDGDSVGERVEALLGAFENERGALQSQLAEALQEADSLRTVRYGLEQQLRDVTSERDRLRSLVSQLESRDRGESDRLFAVESELDAKRLELGALRAQQQTQEERLASLVERAETALSARPEPHEDLVERLTRILAVLELEARDAAQPEAPLVADSRSSSSEALGTGRTAGPSFTVPPRVTSWAQAWQGQDVDAYFGHYSARFRPPAGLSLDEWRALRRQRLTAPRAIAVEISELEVEGRAATVAEARFVQDYRSERFSDRVRKRLELELEQGDWKIVREVSLPLE